VVALHWLAFYGSIKASNASVATICLAVAPVAIALLEPWLHRARLRPWDVALGVAVIPGIVLILHVRKVMRTTDPKNFDPELKKVALSTFGIAVLTVVGLLVG
jgi:drug/metabolite transporter (DMT)-like permease